VILIEEFIVLDKLNLICYINPVMEIAITSSKNGILIRLTEERWKHVVLMHPGFTNKQKQILNTVKNPDYIFQGKSEELLAVSKLSKRTYFVVVYKEETNDGFIITAFDTTDTVWLFNKDLIWSKHS